jgi:hypothetical protein
MSKEYFLNCILRDDNARTIFLQFLRKRHCAENLLFWCVSCRRVCGVACVCRADVVVCRVCRLEVEDYMKLETPEEQEARARAIFEQYILADSPFEVNLSHKLREEVTAGMLHPSRETFTSAQKSIFLLLVHGTFDYFLRSDLYKMYKGTRTYMRVVSCGECRVVWCCVV